MSDQNAYGRPPELTQLGRYMQACGVKGIWLAEQVNVSPSTVNRWMWGLTSMASAMQKKVLEALQRNAEEQITTLQVPLDLLDDQIEPGQPRNRVGTPFDQLVARRRELAKSNGHR